MESIIFFTALLIFSFGLFSKLSEISPITAPMVFVSIGMLTGELGLNWFAFDMDLKLLEILAEVTLIIILFVDAVDIDRKSLLSMTSLPARLLLIGLPLTMVFGFLTAIPFFPGENLWLIAAMAFMLSPTDAALGQAVISTKQVPEKTRYAIDVESGLNDGIALPPVLACLAVLTAKPGADFELAFWGTFALKQICYGVIAGIAIGWTGGKLTEHAAKRKWMNDLFERLTSVSLALLAYAITEQLGGNGFIGAFFAGLSLGVSNQKIRSRVEEFGNAEGQLLSLFVFFLFGMIIVPEALPFWDLNTLIYALLSLTVIRMLPVAIALIGVHARTGAVLFVGWFGPRGIASILYLLMTVDKMDFKDHASVLSVIVLTVLISIFLHGLSAVPLSNLYANYSQKSPVPD